MDTRLLENIGLTKGEIKVYLSLLSLGSSTSGPIILKSKVARSKVYDILEKLKEKGLVSEVIKDQVKCFQALSPERISDYIHNKEKALKQQKEEFEKLLPELIDKQKFTEESYSAKVYVGLESVKTFYIEMVEKLGNEEYLGVNFSDRSLENKYLLLLLHKFHKQRFYHGHKAKILCTPGSNINKNVKKDSCYELRHTDLHLPTDLAIFKDTVATFSWGETPKVFAIISKENTEQYRKFFYDVWKKSKKY